MQLPPDLVIFDCDGVLVDSERVTNRIIRDNLERHGLVLSLDEIMSLFVGGTMLGVMHLARDMGANLPDTWVDDIYAEMFEGLKAECDLIPGIVEVLDALDRSEIPYAVASNGPHAKMQITLVKTGLRDRFLGRIVSREDVANPKPAPDVYLKAAHDVGVSAHRCVVVEDSATGARAGKAAGMFCAGFAHDTPETALRPICDIVFSNMNDLPRLLGV